MSEAAENSREIVDPLAWDLPWNKLTSAAYDRHIEYMLRDDAVYRRLFESDGALVPAKPLSRRRKLRRWLRVKREQFGYWIGGTEPCDDEHW